MTARMVLANIVSFGLQITVLVAAGAALARVFRIDEPRAMLAYWRTLLLACLLLPLCQPWNTVMPPVLTTTTVTPVSGAAPAGALAPVSPRSVTWPTASLVLIALGAGIAARALWLTIGACGLRRLRRDASPLDPLPESVRHAQERIGTRAGMYVSDRVSGPITFGLLRPVVVFPPSVSAMPAHVQEAMAYHELLHVQRRDWLDEILEEAVRSVLWFHPAIWWLIGRIQLTREQVVDQAAIQLTNSRERYVDSLLAIALANSPAAFTPASAFFRRHLLKKRLARILKETTMTTRRLIASLTASAAALALAGTFAVRSFPLEAQGLAKAGTGEPVQIVKGGEHLLHGERPEYPRRAVEQKVEGDVVVDLTLDDRGEVSDARVLSGPEELRKATLEAVLQWHYSPSAISSTVTQATLRFHVPPGGLETAELSEKPVEVSAEPVVVKTFIMKEGVKGASWVITSPQPEEVHASGAVEVVESERSREPIFEGTNRLVDVRTERVSDATARALLAQAGVAVGDVITQETAKRLRQVALAMDEHFRVEFQKNRSGGLVITVLTR
jgi:bla regulator protein BlaR1